MASASLLFGLMGQYRYFYNNFVFDNKPQFGLIAAGMSTGLTESLLYTPFEIIKIRMQVRPMGLSSVTCRRVTSVAAADTRD